MVQNKGISLLFTFLGALVLLFIIAPLGSLLLHSSPAEISETIVDKEVTKSIALTLWSSMLATSIFAFFAIPLAFTMARKEFFGKKLIQGIIDLPVVIPHSAAGIALLTVISKQGIIGKTGGLLGMEFPGHVSGIVLAMAFVSLPFLINAARDGFSAVPERLEKAALNLGATPFKAFITISIPLAWRSILSGLIMMFARGMSEFGAVIIVAYHPMITPVMIYERFGAFGLKYARPVALIFIAVCLVFFILLRYLSISKRNGKS
ncbi:MAG: ABC transporter permease [Salinivirgaceae bacterium]|jgi:molybdate/tungstate transport system permease protein|nr:ABC transporter permease [Salinivirgaceae bacterium]